MSTIRTEAFRRIEADETGFSVTCTASDITLDVALNVDERRALADALDPERERDEWKARAEKAATVIDGLKLALADRTSRAEAAEARTAPAVSRADVAEALSRCLNPEMFNLTFPAVVKEICALFGIEAEQAVDPVKKKATEYLTVMFDYEDIDSASPADWEAATRMARHVLGQEADQ